MSHEVLARVRGLRREQTDAERRLWAHLRARQLGGFKFRRQHPVGEFVLDFFCDEALLGIELDGGQHAEEDRQRYDLERSEWLAKLGIRVLRFWNHEVLRNTEGVLERLRQELAARPGESPLTPALSRRERG
ncbi:MAG: DUF559 domain-containing protein [Deltaproteobacteria bacterium]|nr:DUF559 domain-containing protein [Deltaproteobacteria bacterium]